MFVTTCYLITLSEDIIPHQWQPTIGLEKDAVIDVNRYQRKLTTVYKKTCYYVNVCESVNNSI